MLDNNLAQLKRKIWRLYIISGCGILLFCLLQTIIVTNFTLIETLSFHLPAQLFLASLVTIINIVYTKKVLFDVLEKSYPFDQKSNDDVNEKLYYRIILFPRKLFWMSFTLYPGFILLKYIYELFFVLQFTTFHLVFIILKMISSLSIIFMYSLTITIFLRKYLKPFLYSFDNRKKTSSVLYSFKSKLAISGVFLFVIYLVNLFVYTFFADNSKSVMSNLVLMTFIPLVVFMAFLRNIIYEHVDNLNKVSTELTNILNDDRRRLHKQIPITTLDEVGDLISSYNKIQKKVAGMYKDIDDDLNFAHKVHNQLIPNLDCKYGSISIQAISKPAKDVGGDFYDVLQIKDKYFIMIGDVLGKGLSAALLVSMIIGHFRAQVQLECTAKELMIDLNRILYPICKEGLFVTCGIGTIDATQDSFTYVSAGHLPPLLFDGVSSFYVESSSLPLGVSNRTDLKEISITLHSVTRIVLYTDGIIEQLDEQGEQFGFERLRQLYSESNPRPAEIIEHVKSVASQTAAQDDMSVLTITLDKYNV